MANSNVNKVVLKDGTTLIDLTNDTVAASCLLAGVTAHDKSGAKITGTFLSEFDEELEFTDSITDSSGNSLIDNSGTQITGIRKYKMA